MGNEFVLTKKGKIALEEELEYLKTVKRAEISEQIKVARSFGDLSENAEYTEARNEQSRIEGKIQSLEKTLRTAVVVDDEDINLETVGVNTKVRIYDKDLGEEETYQIMGSVEADVRNHIISNESPVGQALLGHKVGDEVVIEAPGGEIHFLIREISRAGDND